MRRFAWLVLPFLFAGCEATIDDPENPFVINKDREVTDDAASIIGGNAATPGQFRTVVAIIIDLGVNGQSLCTGTLIAPDVVLTAAHCLQPQLLGLSSQAQVTANTFVVFDSTNLFTADGFAVGALDTIPQPGFNVNNLGDNDSGVIVLDSVITDRNPTPIDNRTNPNLNGVSVTKVGYGISQVGDPNSIGIEFFASKTGINCSGLGLPNSRLICYNQQNLRGTCSGDSGGPAFQTINGVRRVVGITSFGDQNCTQFGVDTKVAAERGFIQQFL
jgi:secreted trypsin-like serine protease